MDNGNQRTFALYPMQSSTASAPIDVRRSGTDAMRSKRNILQWTSYLPEDCVKRMIEMGWDVTT
jgi:hypothetical protein